MPVITQLARHCSLVKSLFIKALLFSIRVFECSLLFHNMPAASLEVVIESLSTVLCVWSGQHCVVFLTCLPSLVLSVAINWTYPSHPLKARTGFLIPGLDSQIASALFLRVFQQTRLKCTDLVYEIYDMVSNPIPDGYKIPNVCQLRVCILRPTHRHYFNYPYIFTPAKLM